MQLFSDLYPNERIHHPAEREKRSLYMTSSDGCWDLLSYVPKKDTQTLQKVLNWNLLAASSRVLALAEWMTSEPV